MAHGRGRYRFPAKKQVRLAHLIRLHSFIGGWLGGGCWLLVGNLRFGDAVIVVADLGVLVIPPRDNIPPRLQVIPPNHTATHEVTADFNV